MTRDEIRNLVWDAPYEVEETKTVLFDRLEAGDDGFFAEIASVLRALNQPSSFRYPESTILCAKTKELRAKNGGNLPYWSAVYEACGYSGYSRTKLKRLRQDSMLTHLPNRPGGRPKKIGSNKKR
jgi:hypothetical protein